MEEISEQPEYLEQSGKKSELQAKADKIQQYQITPIKTKIAKMRNLGGQQEIYSHSPKLNTKRQLQPLSGAESGVQMKIFSATDKKDIQNQGKIMGCGLVGPQENFISSKMIQNQIDNKFAESISETQ